MSDWNDAIELAAQYCDKMARESMNVAMIHTAHTSAAANIRLLKKKVMPQEPSVGRIVHVMLRYIDQPGLHLRPAVITRVGPVRVNDVEFPREAGQVGLQLLLAPEDIGHVTHGIREQGNCIESLFSPDDKEWRENHWRWPSRG